MPLTFIVTGGAGFIGSAVVRELVANTDHRVVNVDNLTYAGNLESLATVADSPRYAFARANICDAQAMQRLFDEYKPDIVMHLAAESHVDRSIDGPTEFIQTNVVGTSVLLEAARAYWKAPQATTPEKAAGFCFHHISTDEVYGDLEGPGGLFSLTYAKQPSSDGLAQAFVIGEDFIGKSNVCLVLGDNIFYGQGFTPKLRDTVKSTEAGQGATVFDYQVKDPERFGVVAFEAKQKAISIEEKPAKPQSHFVVTGLYFYDNRVIDIAKAVKPSHRDELEITDINKAYLEQGELNVELLGRGFAWLDTGTHESLLEAAQSVETIEKRQGYKITCLEEVAYNQGWLSREQLMNQAEQLKKNGYGEYLNDLLEEAK